VNVKIRFVDGSGIDLTDVCSAKMGVDWYVVEVGNQRHLFALGRIQAINEITL
jgi:hypothetical protein